MCACVFMCLFCAGWYWKVNRQIKIEEVVNAEVSALSVLVLHLQDYFRWAGPRRCYLIESADNSVCSTRREGPPPPPRRQASVLFFGGKHVRRACAEAFFCLAMLCMHACVCVCMCVYVFFILPEGKVGNRGRQLSACTGSRVGCTWRAVVLKVMRSAVFLFLFFRIGISRQQESKPWL